MHQASDIVVCPDGTITMYVSREDRALRIFREPEATAADWQVVQEVITLVMAGQPVRWHEEIIEDVDVLVMDLSAGAYQAACMALSPAGASLSPDGEDSKSSM